MTTNFKSNVVLNTDPEELYGLLGHSSEITEVRRLISKVLHSDASVLITGETGTGKELVAQALHHYGPWRTGPFIILNCAGMPENLLESELFGYKKGAFTGADKDHDGLLRAAQDGTLFLDEIAEMSISLQAKLLRVLQDKLVRPLGSLLTYQVNIRVITATHQPLLDMIKNKKFRADLYYRLAEFPIHLPPLRKRKKDWKLLAQRFLNEYSGKNKELDEYLSQSAIEKLEDYAFTGNIRELKSMMRRALLLVESEKIIETKHLLLVSESDAETQLSLVINLPLKGSLMHQMYCIEHKLLQQALAAAQGNQCRAAEKLGIKRNALVYRLKKMREIQKKQAES